eukprot:TRINITY_DN2481_c0_g1_i3.p1 TRINITY_DN2481_c0_g1~~TRINITY_DN2481_c0_g1_i3.p1  ORF type:complete len:274 (+),score=63.35 TRINITY_DN2481_c0_g1_i3:74-895(+)
MGCCQNLVKYSLFLTNFLVFVLGLVTLGFGIWVLVDKPGFLDLFDNAQSVLDQQGVDISGFDLGIYAGAPIILIVAGVITSIIAFLGCCGAIKENKCMLISYFVIILAVFIGCIVGAVLVYQGKFDEQIKTPLKDSIKYYKDDAKSGSKEDAYKQVWNTIQEELKCCGVSGVSDWDQAGANIGGAGWTVGNKPEGCCHYTRGKSEENDANAIQACRQVPRLDNSTTYYFEGCYDAFIDEIEKQQDKIFAAAIATVVIMFLNMLCAFALCTMAE